MKLQILLLCLIFWTNENEPAPINGPNILVGCYSVEDCQKYMNQTGDAQIGGEFLNRHWIVLSFMNSQKVRKIVVF
jgi:hypothetical protein